MKKEKTFSLVRLAAMAWALVRAVALALDHCDCGAATARVPHRARRVQRQKKKMKKKRFFLFFFLIFFFSLSCVAAARDLVKVVDMPLHCCCWSCRGFELFGASCLHVFGEAHFSLGGCAPEWPRAAATMSTTTSTRSLANLRRCGAANRDVSPLAPFVLPSPRSASHIHAGSDAYPSSTTLRSDRRVCKRCVNR